MNRMIEEQMEKKEKSVDMVNHPPHYTSGTKEVIDMMEDIWGKETLADYCEINAFKYRMRAGSKNGIQEDIAKAQWYENKANDLRSNKDQILVRDSSDCDYYWCFDCECDLDGVKGVAIDVAGLEEFGEEFDPNLAPMDVMDCYTYVKNNSIPLGTDQKNDDLREELIRAREVITSLSETIKDLKQLLRY